MTESVWVWNLVVCFVYICSLIRWNILITLFYIKFFDSTPTLLLQRYIRHSCLPQNVLWGEQQLQHRKRQDKTETAHLDHLVPQKWADRPGYCVWLGWLDVMTVGRHHGNDCVEKKWCYCSWIKLFWWNQSRCLDADVNMNTHRVCCLFTRRKLSHRQRVPVVPPVLSMLCFSH